MEQQYDNSLCDGEPKGEEDLDSLFDIANIINSNFVAEVEDELLRLKNETQRASIH